MERFCNQHSPSKYICRDKLNCPYFEKGFKLLCHFRHKNYLSIIIKTQMQFIFILYRLLEWWKLFIIRQLIKSKFNNDILDDLIWKN